MSLPASKWRCIKILSADKTQVVKEYELDGFARPKKKIVQTINKRRSFNTPKVVKQMVNTYTEIVENFNKSCGEKPLCRKNKYISNYLPTTLNPEAPPKAPSVKAKKRVVNVTVHKVKPVKPAKPAKPVKPAKPAKEVKKAPPKVCKKVICCRKFIKVNDRKVMLRDAYCSTDPVMDEQQLDETQNLEKQVMQGMQGLQQDTLSFLDTNTEIDFDENPFEFLIVPPM